MSNKIIITEPADLVRELENHKTMGAVMHMIPGRGLSVQFEEGGPRATGAKLDRNSVIEVLKMMAVIRQGKPVVFYDPKRPDGMWQWVAGEKRR